MASWTGLDPVHSALLAAIGSGGSFQKCARVLDRLPAEIELGPLAAYEELGALATPWTALLPLIESHGNFGTPGRDDPPAEARYTECRLTPAGRAGLAAEAGEGPPIPLGLVLGDWFRGGRRPSFDPARVAEAVVLAADGELRAAVTALGPPAFPGGLSLTPTQIGADPRALEQGWLVQGRIDARIEPATDQLHQRPRPGLDIVILPPGYGSWRVASRIAEIATTVDRATGTPLAREINDESTARFGTKIHIAPARGVELDPLERFLRAVPGVFRELELQLPRPAHELLAGWVASHGAEHARAGAELLAGIS